MQSSQTEPRRSAAFGAMALANNPTARIVALIPAAALAGLAATHVQAAGPVSPTTTLVSVSSTGVIGNGESQLPSISADGRFVAFESTASNLVPDDTNNAKDVFVRDRQTEQTLRVSVSSAGAQGSSRSMVPSISTDGRFVAFESLANNLVPGDTNGSVDIFVHDLQTGQTSRVSVASGGGQALGASEGPSISADGRYVAFASFAANLVAGDTNGTRDIFVHDRDTNQTVRVNVTSAGLQANGQSQRPTIAADGSAVAFESLATNLVPNDTNNHTDIFVHDLQSAQTTRVSVSSAGAQANSWSLNTSFSADGRVVAFASLASNLVPGDTLSGFDIFLHDRQTAQTSRVSVTSSGGEVNGASFRPSISADARFTVFDSQAIFVPDDTNGAVDIHMHDRLKEETSRVSISHAGAQGNNASQNASISADGRFVAFDSFASNLVPGDTNAASDVFVRGPLPFSVPCPGDTNGDQMVDFLDLNIVLSFFGQTVAPGTNGDLNGDGAVDFLDLNTVLSFFGHAC